MVDGRSRMTERTFGALLVALALGAAAGVATKEAADAKPFRASSLPPVVVTRDSGDVPHGCSPRQVAIFVSRFFDDFNRGRRRLLRKRLAPPATTRDVGRDAADGRF